MMGLVVAGEERGSSCHIAPFGETRAPPLIVFRDRVVLGEVEGQEFWLHLSSKNITVSIKQKDRTKV